MRTWLDAELTCLNCGWEHVPPEQVAQARAYDEAVRRPGGGAKPRREVRLPGAR